MSDGYLRTLTANEPFAILAVGGLLLVLLDAILGRRRSTSWMAPTLIVLAAAAARTLTSSGGIAEAGIVLDGFGRFVIALVLASAALAVVLSHPYLTRIGRPRGEYGSLLVFSTAGMVLFATSTDLVLLFLGLELLSIPVYILSGYARGDIRSSEAALKYFLLGAFSSAIFLLGVAFVYGASGSTDLRAAVSSAGVGSGLMGAGILLLLSGFLFKVASVPFHMWTPDVYEGAPTAVTAFMATAVKAAAFGALLRVVGVVSGAGAALPLASILWWLAVLTMTLGNAAALTQSNVKRMLAYSSIAHAGYLLIGVSVYAGTRDSGALGGVLYYMLAYTFMTLGAFAVVVAFGEKGNEHLDMGDYGGLGWRYPALGIAMSLFMISLSGIPPTAGFFGKYAIFKNAVENGQIGLVVIAVLNSALSVYYYIRVIVTLYMRPETAQVSAGRSVAIGVVVAVCVLAILWAGIAPEGRLLGGMDLLNSARSAVLATR